MKNYKRLVESERERIFLFYHAGKSIRFIADSLFRSPSTISRELKRNRTRAGLYGYSVFVAQHFSQKRASSRKTGKLILSNSPVLLKLVLDRLQKRWSPQQISRYLKRQYPDNLAMQISHESIYSYIYVYGRGELKKALSSYLRQQRSYRRQQKKHKKGLIKDMFSIEERPKEVEERTVPGHWEGDLIIGKGHKTAIGTIVERTTRLVILVPLKSRMASDVRKAFAREIKRLPEQLRLSMTYDQGREMSQHKLFTKQTNMQVYFAHPHSPWERGTNENTNMLIRDFFPKGTDFGGLSRYRIKKVQELLNDRPRKVLDWRSPQEVFSELLLDYS